MEKALNKSPKQEDGDIEMDDIEKSVRQLCALSQRIRWRSC